MLERRETLREMIPLEESITSFQEEVRGILKTKSSLAFLSTETEPGNQKMGMASMGRKLSIVETLMKHDHSGYIYQPGVLTKQCNDPE